MKAAEAKAKPVKAKAKGKAKAVPPPKLHNCTQCQKHYVNKAGENKCQDCLEKPAEPTVSVKDVLEAG